MADVPRVRSVVRFGLRVKFTLYLVALTVVVLAFVGVRVQQDVGRTLAGQVTGRGLALARNLASSCVEPMSLGNDPLTLMVFARQYIQSGGSESAKQRLFDRPSMPAQVLASLQRFAREDNEEGLANEGVLQAQVVDPANTVVAYADIQLPQESWLEATGKPYKTEPGTQPLSPSEESHIWESPARGGEYVIAVPILARAPEGAAGAEPAPAPVPAPADASAPPAAAPAPAGKFYGVVYLTMSREPVERTVARALAQLALVGLVIVGAGVVVGIVIAVTVTNPIRLLERGVQAIAAGDFKQRISLKRSDELGELTDAFNQMAAGLAERELMSGAFSTFVSKDLLAEIIKNPDAMKVGGARKKATMMFSYFGNHNELGALTSTLDPQAIVKIINDYLEVQAHTIQEHKGYIDKFIADVVVAAWGVPIESRDHALNAVKAAVAIRDRVKELNVARARMGQMTTEPSIGINTGLVVAGNMGSQGAKLDYTVIGADVNFAARLAGAGATLHAGTIWIGRSTWELVRDEFECRDLGGQTFKGIPEPQPVWEVLGIKGAVGAGATR